MNRSASRIGIAVVRLGILFAVCALAPLEAHAQLQAITVPWVPKNPALPHQTYSGRQITLKGISRGAVGTTQYKWDFGDGSGTNFATYTNAYNLSATHVYNGNYGQPFTATLYVSDGSGQIATAPYPVQIFESDDPTDSAQMDVRVAVAEDEALWYLHINMGRSTYGAGANGYSQPYGNWPDQAGTCAALEAFELHGSKPQQNYDTDPYVEDAQRALNYLFANATSTGISQQAGGNPDSRTPSTVTPANPLGSGNGLGIYLASGDSTYTDGICGSALASSGAGSLTTLTGPSGVYNRSYADVMQDVVDWFSYGQSDGTSGLAGGWWYSANYGNAADGSTNQWPIVAMITAQANMGNANLANATLNNSNGCGPGICIPQFVLNAMPIFLNTVHNTNTADPYFGAWGYQASTSYPNVAKTGGGLMGQFLLGHGNDYPDVVAGVGLMYNRWTADTPGNWVDYNLGDSYAMYDVMKAMQQANPRITRIYQVTNSWPNPQPTGASFDWYYTPKGQTQQGLATNIVTRQGGDGSFRDTESLGITYTSVTLDTAWDTLILMKAVANVPPTAKICNCDDEWPVNTPVNFDGSCSTEPDTNRTILNTGYQWDFNYDGTTFVQSLDPVTGYVIQGPQVTNSLGYPKYTEDGSGNPLNPPVTFTVALQVTDDNPQSQGGPLSSLTTCNVIIKPPPHCPNVVIGGPYLGQGGKAILFDGSGSNQIDGDPLGFAWDFHNGVAPSSDLDSPPAAWIDATGAQTSWTFDTENTYTVALAVTNYPPLTAAGQAPSCTKYAYTTVVVGAHAPVASAGGPYTALAAGETIQLDGSGSYDPDGNTNPDGSPALTYAWDLTGSGLYNDSTEESPLLPVNPSTVGTSFGVCVKVTDTVNLKTSVPACSTVTSILAHVPPTCVAAPVVVESCTGAPLDVSVDGSHSFDPNGGHFTYNWTTNDCPGTFDTPTQPTSKITINTAQEGCMPQCTATLTVTNQYGHNSCNQVISLADQQTPAFNATPQNLVLQCDQNTTASVNAWLASATATESCVSPQNPVTVANDFRATATACGGVGAPNSVNGAVKVTWTAIDPCNSNTVQTSATVTVSDTAPPVFSPNPLPNIPGAQATSASGAVVTYSVSANDAATGVVPVHCTPPSGFTFPIGTTTVTCTSTDSTGHVATGTFNVTVVDTQAPVLTLPADITAEATSAAGKAITFSATALDAVDGNTPVSCSTASGPTASGSTFPLGTTTVSCSTSDKHGNTSSETFTVTVQDTTAPVITVPQDIVAEATGESGADVTYTVTAKDAVSPSPTLSCKPASGSLFAIGSNTVGCTASDTATPPNTSTASFTVTVQDTVAPTISGVSAGGGLPVQATSAQGAEVTTYGISATDPFGNPINVTCVPALPAQFPLGITPVTCTTDPDSHGNVGTLSFSVDVVDTTAPTMTCPAPLLVTANGPLGAVNLNMPEPTSQALAGFLAGATATDAVDPSPSISNNGPSLYPVGITTVTFTGTDASDNVAMCTSQVTVRDEQLATPALTCPANGVLSSGGGTQVDWSAVFHHSVSVQLLVLSGGAAGNPLSLSNVGNQSFLLSTSPTASGDFAVRIRAVDDITGASVDCNRFLSISSGVLPAEQSSQLKRSSVPAIPVRY